MIDYEAPYPESVDDSSNWLCEENLQLALIRGANGGIPYKIREIPSKFIRRKTLLISDILYINGGITKIEIINWAYENKPLCKIIETGPHSKFKIGDIVELNRRYLYPTQGKGPKKYKGRKEN